MTPDWQHIASTVIARYPYKVISRALSMCPKSLNHIAAGRRKGDRMTWQQCTQLLALYDALTGREEAEWYVTRSAEWALAQLARMRSLPEGSKVRQRREARLSA